MSKMIWGFTSALCNGITAHSHAVVRLLPPMLMIIWSWAACQVAIVDHELRFTAAFQRGRELLQEGAIGTVLAVESSFIMVRISACYSKNHSSWPCKAGSCCAKSLARCKQWAQNGHVEEALEF